MFKSCCIWNKMKSLVDNLEKETIGPLLMKVQSFDATTFERY